MKELLKVLTFNMQNGQIWDEKNPDAAPIALDRTAEYLQKQEADVYLLQEVEFPHQPNPDPQDHPNQDYLSGVLSSYYTYFKYPVTKKPHLPFGIGLSIFSRYPLENPFHVVLPSAEQPFTFAGKTWIPCERSLIGADIFWNGKNIRILNTHLQAWFMIESDAQEHPEQRQIVRGLMESSPYPCILGGDFNCAPEEGTLEYLESGSFKSVQKDQITWLRQPKVLDHLFYSPQWQAHSYALTDTGLSDHLVLEAEFKLV